MCKLNTIKELDGLPDGAEIELLDKRETRLYKEAGNWRSREKAATQNIYAYVNTRRYGARVIGEETAAVTEKPETIQEIIARYREAYDKREAGILSFLDDEGELKEGQSYEAYDEHSYDAWSDSHGDLSSLLSELEDALRPEGQR
ncbi:hypothetical protein KGG73_gp53 [Streptomyces phage Sentinel]|uniref:Uncharacterized protein n=1 Tax=Streptomyces phage Sentinel TaxID=2767584 RepID=A0A873WEG1_9CAUD|nr:hypothetical protein KGG73_gp53 [Streptomyces phage Sentinel]QPB09887.1 hypothetical protein CPT_Sentinel_053 [Streptomyces phage Sentinel]